MAGTKVGGPVCGFKVKIVQSYEKLFDRNFFVTLESNEKEASDFWKEFFLLKVRDCLESLWNRSDG